MANSWIFLGLVMTAGAAANIIAMHMEAFAADYEPGAARSMWAQAILGAILVLASFCLLRGHEWARIFLRIAACASLLLLAGFSVVFFQTLLGDTGVVTAVKGMAFAIGSLVIIFLAGLLVFTIVGLRSARTGERATSE